jgi:hypothetical protein
MPGDNERWRAYWVDDGERDLLVFYCAACAEREFDPDLLGCIPPSPPNQPCQ